MKIVKIIAMTFVGLGALMCAGASADQPATRPAGGSYTNHQLQVPAAQCALVVGKTTGIHPATQQEWDDMMVFMRSNSPAQAYVLDSIPYVTIRRSRWKPPANGGITSSSANIFPPALMAGQ